MSCSASNTIFVIVMRQKEWEMIQSQATAIDPIQRFGHPKNSCLEHEQARHSTGRYGRCEHPHIQRAAVCVPQQTAETLRAGLHTWRITQTNSCRTAPSSSKQVQLIKRKPAATVYLVPAAPTSISLISLRYSPLLCSTNRFRQQLPMVSM